MAQGSRRTRVWTIVTILVVIALIGACIVAGKWLLAKKANPDAVAASGVFAEEPHLREQVTPGDFDLDAFVPVLGTGNTTQPVSYGDARIMAGATKKGESVLIGLGEGARASWQTSLGGPLIACAAQAQGQSLPCLVKSSTGTLVALVDVGTGIAKWIWEDGQAYINVAVGADNAILLLGSDLSITPINAEGTLTGEPMLSQQPTSPDLVPDSSSCRLGAATIDAPEAFRALSPTMYLITHGGLNTFITIANNQVVGAVPGTLLTQPADKGGRIVVAPSAGCAPAAVVTPGRNRVQLLPADVSVPIPVDHSLPSLVIRSGEFHAINWTGPSVGRPAYASLAMTIEGTPRLAETKDVEVVAGDHVMTAFSRQRGAELWSVSVDAHDLRIGEDVVIVNTTSGEVRGYGLTSGALEWSLPDNALGMLTLNEAAFTVSSENGLFTWAGGGETPARVATGAAASQGEVSPGITYSAQTCVRTTAADGSTAVTTVPVDCGLEGAEPVVGVVTADQVARGKDATEYLKACEGRFPTSVSAITVTSPRVDAATSAICTGNPNAR
ncbi:hypothetical protein H8R18_06930 [Nanchangia anserum]|uniref:Pyrrolo-quinoline quinone n=1 Tax=Nanchangia anserum TaxID=2692125 RepID=A0A8I0G8T6_9ACTO|nr:PQQ-binding-like beta-propeller repeat protein [Nanchangia anserum]MBD3689264.1 hypothetical protein [Nanchangia anserum]QOX81485.1 hypothetical protein H8R18_06930 [Nanchangia anserum]